MSRRTVRAIALALLAAAAAGAGLARRAGAQQPSPAAPPSDRPTQENDNAIFNFLRLEADATQSSGTMLGSWTGEGWLGTDRTRLWMKTDGEREGSALSNAEVQALFSKYVATFWDFQVGLRRTFRPAGENYLAIGMLGLAPYRFEVDGAVFVSDRGRLSGRASAAYELLWTNRLISRPGASVDLFAGRDVALGEPGGIGEVELRFPTRYEFSRRFAPYVETRYTRRSGTAAALARGAGAGAGSGWSLRGGLWLVF